MRFFLNVIGYFLIVSSVLLVLAFVIPKIL
jgi:hypothetical protein